MLKITLFHLKLGFQVNREVAVRLRGERKMEITFDTTESLNNLNLNEKEKAILCVYLYSTPGSYPTAFAHIILIKQCDFLVTFHGLDYDSNELNEALKTLYEFYKRSLLYEFDLNGRDMNFINDFEKVSSFT